MHPLSRLPLIFIANLLSQPLTLKTLLAQPQSSKIGRRHGSGPRPRAPGKHLDDLGDLEHFGNFDDFRVQGRRQSSKPKKKPKRNKRKMGQEQSVVGDDTPPRTLSERSLAAVAEYIKSGRARRIVVMTGAGISTAAGSMFHSQSHSQSHPPSPFILLTPHLQSPTSARQTRASTPTWPRSTSHSPKPSLTLAFSRRTRPPSTPLPRSSTRATTTRPSRTSSSACYPPRACCISSSRKTSTASSAPRGSPPSASSRPTAASPRSAASSARRRLTTRSCASTCRGQTCRGARPRASVTAW